MLITSNNSCNLLKLVGNALTSEQHGNDAVTIQAPSTGYGNDGKKDSKIDEDRKRERNILSSRKYRAKRYATIY